jgi:hypothetical protein
VVRVSQAPAPEDPVEAELAAIARECRFLAQRLGVLTSRTRQEPLPPGGNSRSLQVRRYLHARRLRERLLPPDLFADPVWDMLLDLYASELEGKRVCISSACIAAAVPSTTALRWLGRLEELDLVARELDPADSRRNYVRLSGVARDAIDQWLSRTPWLTEAGDGDDGRRS